MTTRTFRFKELRIKNGKGDFIDNHGNIIEVQNSNRCFTIDPNGNRIETGILRPNFGKIPPEINYATNIPIEDIELFRDQYEDLVYTLERTDHNETSDVLASIENMKSIARINQIDLSDLYISPNIKRIYKSRV